MSDNKTSEVGDEVLVRATVIEGTDEDGDLRRAIDGRRGRAAATGCTVVDSDELKVGDEVTFDGAGQAWIAETGRYRVRFGNGALSHASWRRDELTKVPAKPMYTVERTGDYLALMQTLPGGKPHLDVQVDAIPREDPGNVASSIEGWGTLYGQAVADEARKLAAVRTVIDSHRLTPLVSIVAVRYATGWCAKINVDAITAASHVAETGAILTDAVGKAHFPTPNGPYLTEKP